MKHQLGQPRVTFICPILYFSWHFYRTSLWWWCCTSDFGYSTFTYLMTLYAYWIADFGEIFLIWLCFPTIFSTCFSSVVVLFLYFSSLCAPSISNVYKIHTSLSLMRQVALPILFLVVVTITNFLNISFFTYPVDIRFHRCFR